MRITDKVLEEMQDWSARPLDEGRLQTELLNTKKWSTTLEMTAAMADHIDNFHNVELAPQFLTWMAKSERAAAFGLLNFAPDVEMQ